MERQRETVHIAFSKDDFDALSQLAKEKELKLATFLRSFILTSLRPKGRLLSETLTEKLKENE